MPALFHGYGAVDTSSCTALAVAQGLTVVLPRRPNLLPATAPVTVAMLAAALAARLRGRRVAATKPDDIVC